MILYRCDGCFKEEPAVRNSFGDSVKPLDWFVRGDKDGEQHACSRKCVEKIAAESGKTSVVLPI